MKIIKFKVHIYEWRVTVLIINKKKDIPKMKKIMRKFKIPEKFIKFNAYHAKKGDRGGIHSYQAIKHRSLIIIYNCNNIHNMAGALSHELRHLADRILEYIEINDFEASAQLTGYIARKVIPEIFKLK